MNAKQLTYLLNQHAPTDVKAQLREIEEIELGIKQARRTMKEREHALLYPKHGNNGRCPYCEREMLEAQKVAIVLDDRKYYDDKV